MLWLAALVCQTGPSLTLAFTGDAMLNAIKPGPGVFRGIRSVTETADVAFVNLEVPLTEARLATPYKTAAEIRARDQFVLKASPRHTAYLREAGFDLVSLANNHAMDYRAEGLAEMIGWLNRKQLVHAGAGRDGAEAQRVKVFATKSGVRVGLVSALAFMSPGALRKCTPANAKRAGIAVLSFGGTVNAKAREKVGRWVAQARKECDLLVVALHWGIERQTLPTPYQVQLGRAFVDAGADVVWGHHPHVLQGAEIYRGKPILYSLGNLISPLPGESGIITMTFRGGKFEDPRFDRAVISGGKVTLAKGQGRMPALCDALRKRYQNRLSVSPFPR